MLKYQSFIVVLILCLVAFDDAFEEIYPEDDDIWLDGIKVPIKD